MGKARLCSSCGSVLGHARECPLAPPPLQDPEQRLERVRDAIRDAERRLADAEALASRDAGGALLLVLEAETLLAHEPVTELRSFEDKRAHNNAETKLAAK